MKSGSVLGSYAVTNRPSCEGHLVLILLTAFTSKPSCCRARVMSWVEVFIRRRWITALTGLSDFGQKVK